MKWVGFVDCIDSVEDGISIVLINEERIVGIYSERVGSQQQGQKAYDGD